MLSGLVEKKAGLLKIKNRIYAEVFNLEWVEKQLGKLRPTPKVLKLGSLPNKQILPDCCEDKL